MDSTMDSQSDVDSLMELDAVKLKSKSSGRGRARGRSTAKPRAKPQSVSSKRPRRSKASSKENESVTLPAAVDDSSSLQQSTLEESSQASGKASGRPVHGSRETQEKLGITPNDMFAAVLSPKTAMVTVVDEWLDSYKQDREEGMWALINFIVLCCGCKGVVSRRMLDNMDNATIISKLTKDFKEASEYYPLCTTGAKWKGFSKSLCEFVRVLVRSCENGLLYDDNLFAALLPLLTSLSDSQVRAFRHTSTLLAMTLMTGIVGASVKVSARLQTTTRHYENEINKPVQRQDFTRLEELQNTITQLKENREELMAMINSAFSGVFVHRYRDVVPEIRAICVQELGNCVMHNPEIFLDDQYLKYLGWILHDSQGSVRLQCVRVLQCLYREKDFVGRLEMFTSRFKERILCMALDKELDVAVEVMQLLLLIYQQTEGGLTDRECGHLHHMVFASNRGVAAGAGTFVYNIWKRQAAGEPQLADEVDTKVFFQSLVNFYIKSEFHEHGSYLVDSLWGVPELKDWDTMTSLLLHEPGLQYEQEGALIEIMICAIRQAAEAKAPVGREQGKKVLNKKDKQSKAQDRRRISSHFIPVLPQLLAKYSADAKNVSLLLEVPLHFDLETYSTNGQLDKYLDLLLEQMCDIVLKHTEASVLEACTSLFASLCSEQYTFCARSKTAIGRLLDSLADRLSPLLSNVLEGTADEDDQYGAATALTKIATLSRSFNIIRGQYLEPCLELLSKGVKSGDMNKQLMVAALQSAAFHLLWARRPVSDSSSPALMDPKQVKKAVKSFYKVSEKCLSSDHAEIRDKAFELLCDLLVLYSSYAARSQADLWMLSCSCPQTLQNEMSGFLVDFIFTDPENGEHDDEPEEVKLAAVQRKRNQLAGYCKLILFGVLDLKAATDVFKYYVKFYNDFGDIIKLLLNKSKLIDPVESAMTVCLCLQQLFTYMEPTENAGREFVELTELAKRLAMSLGVNLQRIQEPLQALHTEGIRFAFHGMQEVEGGLQPTKLLFLEILSEFSFKVLHQNRSHITAILKAKCSKAALSWPSVRMYHRSLITSTSSPAQPKHRRPASPEPSPPGSASGSEGSIPFPSELPTPTLLNVSETSSSPLPTNLGTPPFSSTVLLPELAMLTGLDKDKHIPEPEEEFSEGSQMRNVNTQGQRDSDVRGLDSRMDILSSLSLIEEAEEEEPMIEDFEEGQPLEEGQPSDEDMDNDSEDTLKSTRQTTSTRSSFLEDLF